MALPYFRAALEKFHGSLLDAVRDLSSDQLHFRPLAKGNSIAFMLWHTVRTEDMIVNGGWQKKLPVWNAEGWAKKLAMDSKSQGTGMSAEQAASLRISDLREFLLYAEKVFQTTEAFLEKTPVTEWEEVRELPFLGKRDLYQLIGGVVLQHGSGHLAEIWYVKGLQGLKGSPM